MAPFSVSFAGLPCGARGFASRIAALARSNLRLYCRKRDDVRALIDAEIAPAPKQGRPKKVDDEKAGNISFSGRDGNTATHAIARLKRDAPELAEKVVKGELSANAAAIQAARKLATASVPASIKEARVIFTPDLPLSPWENRPF